MLLGIVFAFSPIIFNNNLKLYAGYSDDIDVDYENVKLSKVSGKIHINNNWTDAWNAGICTGNGTYSDPYVIEDLVIDGEGSGSCILIENSNEYFKIENCTVYNSEMPVSPPYDFAGIRLYNTSTGQLIGNNCSISNFYGIMVIDSHYNNISGNTLNNNIYGIDLHTSDDNDISGNNATGNSSGMYISGCDDNTISGNTFNINTEGMWLGSSNYNNISGNIVNHNSGNGIYLQGGNDNNDILGNIINNNYYGIHIRNSDNNEIMGNVINNNDETGIILRESNYNTVSGNELLGNKDCILEFNCEGNEFSNNVGCKYGEKEPTILGYNLLFLLGILSVAVILISKKLKKS